MGAVTSLVVLLTGATVGAPTAAAAAAAPTPALYGCAGVAHHRPHTFQLACGDGNGYFDRASWQRWEATAATGKARQWYNTCKPTCSAGNYIKRVVSVRLYRARTLYGQRYFSRIKVGGPHGYRAPTPQPHRLSGGAYHGTRLN